MAGSVFKRCGCRDAAGRPLTTECPQLKRSDHGSWYYKAELPAAPWDGARRRARKGGFATRRDAQQALTDLLDRVQKRTHLDRSKERTLATYLEGWLASKRGLRATTRRSTSADQAVPRPGARAPAPGPAVVDRRRELYAAPAQRTGTDGPDPPMLARLLEARPAEGARPLATPRPAGPRNPDVGAERRRQRRTSRSTRPPSSSSRGRRRRRSCGPTNGCRRGGGPATVRRSRCGPRSRPGLPRTRLSATASTRSTT